ncbi:MazG-like family protein [Staphylococcus pseudintermedius]|uniref:MazG-like family protein n=1 Tax=Staphylococcus pseudintermedius TaxID=283734 RepID=UPI0036F208A6
MEQLINNIEQWSTERGLHEGSPIKQFDKLVEEFGELVKGQNKQDKEMIKDSVGDMFIVLTIMVQQIKRIMNIEDNDPLMQSAVLFSYILRDVEHSTVDYILTLGELGDKLQVFYEERTDLVSLSYILTSITDLIALLDVTTHFNNTDIKSCVQLAYDEIKDRKGKIIDGKFIKEADLEV